MNYNINSGYGRLMADSLRGGFTGKVFLVGKSALAHRDRYNDILGVDTDGVPRFHATIAGALTRCTASSGDTIFVLPGHTEAFSSATTATWNVAGVNIVGLGSGTMRPTLTLDTGATSTINITAENIKVKNIIVVANFADIASAFTLTTAAGFTLEDVEVRDTSSILNFLNVIDTDTTSNNADDITMLRVRRLGDGATTATHIIKMDGTNKRLRVKDCYFAHASVDNGALFMVIATGKVVTDMEVSGCIMNFVGVSSATAGVLITTNGSTNSGFIASTYVKHLDATTEIMVTASSGFIFMDLKASAVADKQGYLVPGADA